MRRETTGKEMSKDTTDWKAIATALAQRVNMAITHLTCQGRGIIGNLEKPAEEWQHWRDYMADALEMFPGVKVDRELMHVNNLPRAKRSKEYKRIMADREKAGAGETATTHNAQSEGAEPLLAKLPLD